VEPILKRLLSFGLLLIASSVMASNEPVTNLDLHPCQDRALVQAEKLLTFHFGYDDRIFIDPEIVQLSDIKNPAGKDYYDVLEVWGYIYKGRYRMTFTYAQGVSGCLLMGQRILEYADVFAPSGAE
jgi:hypothetical protein